MNNTKKMVLMPYQDGGEDEVFENQPSQHTQTEAPVKRGNSIRKYAAERQQKLLHIVLKLATHGGYDENGNIRGSNGESYDVVPLLLHASSPGRNVRGLTDFVNLLYKAGVSPDLIINSSVRDLLTEMMRRGGQRRIFRRERPENVPLPPPTMDEHQTDQGQKRALRPEVKDDEPASKKENWDANDSDDD